MRKGKYQKHGVAAKTLVLILTLVLLVGGTVGGTLAWLTATSATVVNTFTESDIKIELTETTGEEYKMIPGHYVTKNPKVILKDKSEPCYLFVQITENLGAWADNKINNADPKFTDYLGYEVDSAWTALEGETGVYYMTVDRLTTADETYPVLKDNRVTVAGIVTKEMMDEIDEDTEDKPTLTFTAYAVQLYKNNTGKFTAAEAWANAQKLS